ncbi:putative zinc-binding protein [Aminivibrio sp.]|uniref:putative zinc-binding protein n=1 Tax=Aminivibrio sp. TaxID=1872489 RepID=UPI001A371231|nr:putative zinc-binding protein [Aminivibrio sp.]MBL3538362.1 putative zinc-binding protein [Aminivibrio sp.]
MSVHCGCGCEGGAPKIIFCCAGAADIGATAYGAARKLTEEGYGSLACLALVGAGSEGLILSARFAGKVLAMDGCPLDCTRKMLEKAGIENFEHFRLTDVGMKKGECPPTEENIEKAAAEGRTLLAAGK